MLEAIMVISFIYGIRYLMLFNRPMDKLDAGDIAFINKQRKKKQIFLTVEEVKATFKKRGIGMLVTAGVLLVIDIIFVVAVYGSMLMGY